VDAGVSELLFNEAVAHRGLEQQTSIDMHPINASSVHDRLATRLPGAARLIFDPDHSNTPRTLHAPVRPRLVRGHYSAPKCSISSPVALNVSLCREK
jgi:hypothetical protein